MRILIIILSLLFSITVQAGFDESYIRTAQIEGGFVDHPDDRGGRTYHGIAEKFSGDWVGWSLIEDELATHGRLTRDFDKRMQPRVRDFYYQNYWVTVGADKIENENLQFQLWDIAVNQGVRWAGKCFQKSLNFLNRNQRDYDDVKVDGKIGPSTLYALEQYNNHRSGNFVSMGGKRLNIGSSYNLLVSIAHCKNDRYFDLAENYPEQQLFMNGWLKRDVQEYLEIILNAGFVLTPR